MPQTLTDTDELVLLQYLAESSCLYFNARKIQRERHMKETLEAMDFYEGLWIYDMARYYQYKESQNYKPKGNENV